MPEKSLYQALTDAGIPTSNHYSDLYFPVTPESLAILEQYPIHKGNATRFINQITNEWSVDVPFGYNPYWEARRK